MKQIMNKSILGGVIGTATMTMVMYIAPIMGMPKMSPPEMLAGMLNLPVVLGWVMHFMIGIVFAIAYTYLFAPKVKISNIYIKGALFGFIAFVFAQIMMAMMDAIFPMPPMEGSMILVMAGSIIGHVVFGMTVSKIAESGLV